MMLARHSKPMETSSPVDVVSPLWQAMQRSEVWNLGSCDLLWSAPRHNFGESSRNNAAER